MTKRGFAFEFEIPDGWTDDSDGGQVVAHGPSGEELIVSGSVVTGQGNLRDLARVRQATLDNAFESVRDAASVPELTITKDLAKDEGASACECWTLFSQTLDGKVFFGEAVLATDVAVMIATFEAPSQPSNAGVLRDFLRSVRKATTH